MVLLLVRGALPARAVAAAAAAATLDLLLHTQKKVIDLAERAAQRWEPSWTVFLTPPVAADAMTALRERGDVVAVPWGGYAQAERVRCVSDCVWARCGW